MNTKITFYALLLFALGSCCKALPPSIELIINNLEGNNIVSSVSDSTWTWVENNQLRPMVIVGGQSDNILTISSDGFQSGQDYYFYSTHADIDTINILYEDKGWNCNLSTKVEAIVYNGNVFEGGKKDALHRIIKL
jgi:hypothetical protein